MVMFVWWVLERLDAAYHSGYLPEWAGRKVCDSLDNYYTSE